MTEGAVQLNVHGGRFHDETGGYSEAAVAVLAQPGGVAWNVFDDRLLALGRGFPDFRDAETARGAVRDVSGGDGWGYLSGNGLLSAIAAGSAAALVWR